MLKRKSLLAGESIEETPPITKSALPTSAVEQLAKLGNVSNENQQESKMISTSEQNNKESETVQITKEDAEEN